MPYSGAPQALQNRAWAETCAWHLGQVLAWGTAWPHWAQNFAPSGRGA